MKLRAEIHKELQSQIDKLPRHQGYTIIRTQKEWDLYERYTLLGPAYHVAAAYDRPIMSELPFAVLYDYNDVSCGQDFVCYSYLAMADLEILMGLLQETPE